MHVVFIHGPAAAGAIANPIVPFDVTGAGASGTLTGRYLDAGATVKESVRKPSGAMKVRVSHSGL